MRADKLIQDAPASTKSIIYQLCVAVDKCYDMVAGQKVLIECQGDVTVQDSIQVEVKHYNDALTDNHINFWKTLRNWMQDNFDITPYSSLILYTTQQFGERAKIKQWNSVSPERRLGILKEIHEKREDAYQKNTKSPNGNKEKPPDVLLYQREVLNTSRQTKLEQVIAKFVIAANTPTLPELYQSIKERHIKGILEGKKDDFLNALIGFVAKPQSSIKQRWEITYEEFDKQVGALNTQYCRETREFPSKYIDTRPDDHQRDAYRNHLFVSKIRDIEYSSAIPDAIDDYITTVRTINNEFGCYQVTQARTNSYITEMVRIFTTRYRTACRNCKDTVTESQNFYDAITVEEPRAFEGFDTVPMAFRNGLLHTQLDDENKHLQWKLRNHE